MKKLLLICIAGSLVQGSAMAQLFPKKGDSSSASVKTSINKLLGKSKSGPLSTEDIAAGLKEALSIGAQRGSDKLSAVDGFFKNAALKILMPPEAKKVEETLRNLGMGRQVDQAILSMNRAAEDAAKSANPKSASC